ncbi:putative acetyltransferase [Alkalibacillus filiformis]|uniref:Acetyltransferase n=1 Tax=Alkalibacillus filiformis TaxID=200990 RepID=A0ABU0DUW1_9BACI|nr:GNAT family N-acetyltransferase [Alkalibacillus filiformis]MDQ0352145.1 putative acetyltransferase [Alkalibacillus filiformis]
MSLKLIKPTTSLQDAYIDFYQEWVNSGEDIIPSALRKDPSNFEAFVQNLISTEEGVGLPEGYVPATTRWLVDEKYKILGACNIRHDLTGPLLETGGHVGYGVRPSERGKGHATFMLNESLTFLKALEVPRALVTCNDGNEASLRVIEKCGGMQGLPFTEEDGNVVRRFWIDLRD